MKPLIIVTDADDVLWDLCYAWVDYLNFTYNTSVSVDDVKEWDMRKSFPMLSDEQIYSALFDRTLWAFVKPIDKAKKYIEKIKELGHSVYICTDSHYLTVPLKYDEVLLKHFKSVFSIKDVIITGHKELINCDIMIDDNPNNLLKQKQGLLFTRNHNLTFCQEDYKNIERVNSWEEIYNYIKEFN